MTDLVVIVPSRGRPEAAEALVQHFRNTCTADTQLVFVTDEDDEREAGYRRVVRVANLGEHRVGVGQLIGANKSMVEALNRAASALAPPFAIGFMGDDHLPRTHGWDSAYVAALRELGTGIVYGNDLLQGAKLPTQCAMTADIVRALGYMSPPSLTHMYVDNFWLDLGRAAGCIRYLPEVVVEHRHPTAGKAQWDEGYRRVNDPSMYHKDEAAYRAYRDTDFTADVDKVRMLLPAKEWRLFEGDQPFVSTLDFHRDRDRAPHLEQPEHRSRLLAAVELIKDAWALERADQAVVKKSGPEPSVVDLGCGDGGLLSLLIGMNAWGYDFQPSNAAGWAERGVQAQALDVFGKDRDRVQFGDIAVMTEVLEHLADPHGVLRWVAASGTKYLVASSPRFERPDFHAPEHAWAWNERGFADLFTGNGWRILRHDMDGATQLVLAEVANA